MYHSSFPSYCKAGLGCRLVCVRACACVPACFFSAVIYYNLPMSLAFIAWSQTLAYSSMECWLYCTQTQSLNSVYQSSMLTCMSDTAASKMQKLICDIEINQSFLNDVPPPPPQIKSEVLATVLLSSTYCSLLSFLLFIYSFIPCKLSLQSITVFCTYFVDVILFAFVTGMFFVDEFQEEDWSAVHSFENTVFPWWCFSYRFRVKLNLRDALLCV
jgi:hypothetical protein